MSGMELGPLIFKSLVGGFASKIAGDIFSDDEPAPQQAPAAAAAPAAAPAVEAPAVMPIPDDKATAAARKRSIAKSMARRGRQSTILTDPVTGGDAGDALGG